MVLTSFGRVRRLTERAAGRLPTPVDVLELDVNREEDLAAVADRAGVTVGEGRRRSARDRVRARGCARRPVHDHAGRERGAGVQDERVLVQGSGGGAGAADGGRRLDRRHRFRRVASPGRSTTGWASRRRRWSRCPDISPATSVRPGSGSTWLRRDRSAPSPRAGSRGSSSSPSLWERQAPLGWDIDDPIPVARAICFLLSDYARGITGEIVHVDGGFPRGGGAGDL